MAIAPQIPLHKANDIKSNMINESIGLKCMLPFISNSSTKLRKKKSVRFPASEAKMCEVVCNVDRCSSMNRDERDTLWYSAEEFTGFKNQARTVSRRIRNRNVAFGFNNACMFGDILPGFPTYLEDDATSEDSCNRGLEFRMSIERQKNKIIAKKAVLEAQRRLRRKFLYDAARGVVTDRTDSENRLASVAAKFSHSARDLAIKTGMVDFVTAYPLSLDAVPANLSIIPMNENQCYRRRNSNTIDDTPASKRIRCTH